MTRVLDLPDALQLLCLSNPNQTIIGTALAALKRRVEDKVLPPDHDTRFLNLDQVFAVCQTSFKASLTAAAVYEILTTPKMVTLSGWRA